MNKLSILVIDVWMPTPDQDGASLRIVNLLMILKQMAHKLTFGVGDSPSWRNPTNWHPLQDRNMELLDGNTSVEDHLRQFGRIYNVVILSRLSVATRYLQYVQQCAPQATIIFDTTDLHFLRGYRGARITGKINLLKSALLAKKDELSIAKQADFTLVVSPVEKEILEKECPGIRVRILSLIQTIYGSTMTFSKRNGIVFVGSFSHHPNIDAMAYFHKDIYPLLKSKFPGVKITIIGNDPPVWLKQLKSDDLVITDHVPDIAPYFNQCKLSIAPLRYGAGIKSKVVLSMSYGVPVVASSIAAEGIPVIDGQDMLIADTPEDFSDRIIELYNKDTLWSQVSENGLQIVAEHFSFSTAKKRLIELFNAIP